MCFVSSIHHQRLSKHSGHWQFEPLPHVPVGWTWENPSNHPSSGLGMLRQTASNLWMVTIMKKSNHVQYIISIYYQYIFSVYIYITIVYITISIYIYIIVIYKHFVFIYYQYIYIYIYNYINLSEASRPGADFQPRYLFRSKFEGARNLVETGRRVFEILMVYHSVSDGDINIGWCFDKNHETCGRIWWKP